MSAHGKVFPGKNKAERIDGTDDADKINGKGGNDFLVGHHGDDLINGGAGKDTIYGGQDHDILTGGAGADMFMFNSKDAADSDVVKDFKHGTDSIGLDSHVFRSLHVGDFNPDFFFEGAAAHDKNDHLIYDSKGNLYFDRDGKGGEDQFLLATFSKHPDIDASDVFVF